MLLRRIQRLVPHPYVKFALLEVDYCRVVGGDDRRDTGYQAPSVVGEFKFRILVGHHLHSVLSLEPQVDLTGSLEFVTEIAEIDIRVSCA